MKRLLPAVCFALAMLSSAATAGAPEVWRYNNHSPDPPFARSGRADSVWGSTACWNECGSATTWNLVACLARDAQGHCLRYADAGDRSCQRACRTRGGPFLPLDTLFPFEY
ncbi:MAG TPA: hypothetical protein VMG39_12050 [Pseudolabrys sp.]|nr:hypothetical protein [Pseudolabrys sp.]